MSLDLLTRAEAELAYLSREIYPRKVKLLVKRIDAHDRFSDRC